MAQKKITDLTLRTDFDATCNLPADDSIQTWRVTGQQVLDYIIDTIPKPTIQTFASGSGTYTKPAGCKWIRVRMVGGGAGGGGGGSSGAVAGNPGTDSTFGTSLLVAYGGSGGPATGGVAGGAGGAASLGTGPIGIALTGGSGGGCQTNSSGGSSYTHGGAGGVSAFGGSAGSSPSNGPGDNGAANTGSGGAGGGITTAANAVAGGGGGAGGYVDAIIQSPSATYPYVVGSGGAAGSSGTNGYAGGSGTNGMIIVEEHYI